MRAAVWILLVVLGLCVELGCGGNNVPTAEEAKNTPPLEVPSPEGKGSVTVGKKIN